MRSLRDQEGDLRSKNMYKDQGSPTGSFNGLHLKSNFLAVSQSFSLEHTRALRGAKESFPTENSFTPNKSTNQGAKGHTFSRRELEVARALGLALVEIVKAE